jgi:hypothetical protein
VRVADASATAERTLLGLPVLPVLVSGVGVVRLVRLMRLILLVQRKIGVSLVEVVMAHAEVALLRHAVAALLLVPLQPIPRACPSSSGSSSISESGAEITTAALSSFSSSSPSSRTAPHTERRQSSESEY